MLAAWLATACAAGTRARPAAPPVEPAGAPDTGRRPVPPPGPPDTAGAGAGAGRPDTAGKAPVVVHRLKPLPAFFQSLLIPGWSQSKLDRKLTGSLFVSWEGVTLGMFLKARGEVRYLQRIGADSSRITAKLRERQDWLVLLGFNHLFAGLEAYVASQLQDFPADVRLRAAPGGLGFEAVVPFRIP
jgi:hypothetical protein